MAVPTLLLLVILLICLSIQVHVQAQTELFNYVIRQLNSRDLTYSLVGVTRNVRDNDCH